MYTLIFPPTIHHSLFTIHYSPFTIHHSLFTIHYSPPHFLKKNSIKKKITMLTTISRI
jgi:hypothetical protein